MIIVLPRTAELAAELAAAPAGKSAAATATEAATEADSGCVAHALRRLSTPPFFARPSVAAQHFWSIK